MIIQETWLRSSTPRRKSPMMLGRMVTTTTWSSGGNEYAETGCENWVYRG